MEPACSSQASVINNYSCCRRSGTRYQWRPNVSTSCALYKTRPNVRQRLGSELAAQRRTPRTHARTHARTPPRDSVFDHAYLKCVAIRDVRHVRQWLHVNWLRSLIQNIAGFFLHRNFYSKILYKHEINLFSRISVMNYENVLQPKTSCKITLMCM